MRLLYKKKNICIWGNFNMFIFFLIKKKQKIINLKKYHKKNKLITYNI